MKDPSVDIGYVFLYFYGLERRVLADIVNNDTLRHELSGIRQEVDRLHSIYGDFSSSFDGYASELLNAIKAAALTGTTPSSLTPPPLEDTKWPVPVDLRIAIGHFAANEIAIPPEWALAWAWYHPDVRLRTPARRCTDELLRLFASRYSERFPDGFTARPGRAKLRLEQRVANYSLGQQTITVENIPNTFELKGPVRKIDAILQQASTDLDSYSRWLGRNPDSKDTIAAASLLPAEAIDASLVPAKRFTSWAAGALSSERAVRVPASDLVSMWLDAPGKKLNKSQSASLLSFAQYLGYGIEPDARFGGPNLQGNGTAVLFRLPKSSPQAASSRYETAMTVIHLAAAVSAADGDISGHEVDLMGHHAERHLQLTPAEQTRLFAHLLWLATTDIKLTGLKKRIAALSEPSRQSIGDILISISTSDGNASPDEVSTIIRIYRLLELDHTAVPGRIHAALARSRGGLDDAPVMVQPATDGEAGYAIPEREEAPSFSLDREAIARIHADTAVVSSLLHDIFVDEDEETEAKPEPSSDTSQTQEESIREHETDTIPGLDTAHSRLLTTLASKPQWAYEEFADLAARFHIMPNGAIDTINEVAFDTIGEPVLDGDDPVSVYADLIEEMIV